MRPRSKHLAWKAGLAMLASAALPAAAEEGPVNLDDYFGVAECFGTELGMEGGRDSTNRLLLRAIDASRTEPGEGFDLHKMTKVIISGPGKRTLAYRSDDIKTFTDKSHAPDKRYLFLQLDGTRGEWQLMRFSIDGKAFDFSEDDHEEALERMAQEPERVETAFKTIAAALKCVEDLDPAMKESKRLEESQPQSRFAFPPRRMDRKPLSKEF